ncbi:MAG: hypothetical protein RDV48_02585 [Candidatus Eremiobacteraeota bacterium]|nr:hypothetical protein [Candidatus Eremiobacteraeota bacterium]
MVKITGSQIPPQAERPQGAPQQKEEQAAPSQADSVNISGKSTGTVGKILKGIAMFPIKAAETASGIVVGTASAAIHGLPGTAEGISEAVNKETDYVDTGWYKATLMGEFIAGGAVTGFMLGGPVGAGIGAAAGLFTGGLLQFFEGKARFPKEFCRAVEESVDTAIQDNQGPSKAQTFSQDITEGAIVGTAVGMKKGWDAGYEAGKGIIGGVRDVAEGVIEGIEEAIKFKDEE